MLMFDRERSSRIGVLRKDASSELGIRWFKLPAMYAYHVANAWQMCGSNGWMKIHIFLCVYDDSVCALYPASAGPHQQGSKFCSLLSLNGSHKTPLPYRQMPLADDRAYNLSDRCLVGQQHHPRVSLSPE